MTTNSQQLTFAIRAVNEAQRALNDVKGQIGDVGDAAEKGDGKLGKMGGALADMGKIAGGIILAKAFDGLTSSITGAFQAAIEYQQIQAQTEAVIRSTGGVAGVTVKQVTDLGNALEQVTLFGNDVIQSGENLLLTFTGIGKDVFPAATKTMLDMSQALGQDVKSSAIQLGKALNDPIQGVTALRRVGVSFNDEQLNTIRRLQESGDLMGAQKVILTELNKEFGGAAEAAGKTFGGQLTIMKNNLGDATRDLAMAFLPALVAVTGWLVQFAQGFAAAVPYIISFVEDGLAKIAEFAEPAIKPLKELAETSWDALVVGAKALTALASAAWDKISGPLGDLAGLAWGGLKAAADALVMLASAAWDKAVEGFNAIKEFASANVVPKLKDAAAAVLQMAESKIDQLAPQFEKLKTAVADIRMEDVANGLQKVREKLEPAITFLKPLVEGLLESLRDQAKEVGERLAPLVQAVKDFGEALEPLMPLLKPIAEILAVGLVVAIGAFLLTLRGLVEFITLTLIVAITGITLALDGVTWTIEHVITPAVNSIKKDFGDLVDLLQKGAGLIGAALTEAGAWFTGFLNTVSGPLTTVIGWLQSIIEKAQSIPDMLSKINPLNLPGGGVVSGALGSVTSPFRAAGGPVSAGMSYIVGERGPEWFVPNTSGTIVPNGVPAGGTTVIVQGSVWSVDELAYELQRRGFVTG